MTQMIDLSGPQLERKLGRVISEMELVIAKNLALGVSREQLCEILGNGISVEQIADLQETPEFQELYGVIAQHLLELSSEASIGWDQLEAISIRNLMKEARVNRDPDFQLRLAAVANKAQRRHNKGEQILEPGAAGTRVQISLSQRFIKKLNGETEITERRVDVTQMRNPTLDEVTRTLQLGAIESPEGPRTNPPEPEPPKRPPIPVIQERVRAMTQPKHSVQPLDGDSALAAVLKSMAATR
jgi:hypothetical protein